MKKIVIMLLSLFSIITISNAQNQTISGTVTDKSDGSPLPGVTVLVKDTNNATSTDLNGNYSISNVEPNSVLVFSFVGFDTYETQASNSKIDVPLKAKVTLLNEVVVSSLFIERERKELGYSMQELKSKEFEAIKDPNLLNNLSGRVSGVNITQGNSGVGSSSKMYIRGESSLSGDNQPLFVVDGIPVNNYQTPSVTNSSSSGAQEVDYGNGAGEINPDDIESITILKGASAAALYGSRAANGVVLISTKSGGRTKGVSVMVNHTTTFEKLLIEPTFQNQYGQGSKGLWEYEDGMGGGLNDDEDVSWGPALDQGLNLPQFDGPAKGIVDGELVTVRGGDVIARREAANAGHDASITPTPWVSNPDNIKDFFETGVTNQDNVAITAANDNSDYRISYTRLTSEGVIPNNNLNRNTVSLRTGYDLTRKIKINSFISYINSNSTNRPGMGYGSENPMYLFAWYGRQVNTAALKDYWQAGQEGLQQYNYNSAWHDNPYFSMYENTNSFNRDRLLGNIYASYNITNSLSLMVRTGLDHFSENRESKRAYSSQRFRKGMYREENVNWMEQNSDFLLTYKHLKPSKIGFSTSVGGNRMEQKNLFTSSIANELAVPELYSLNNSAVPVVSYQSKYQKRINSLYGLAQLSFNSYLFLDITGRNDWSSTLPMEHNSYFYPSFTLSGVVSDMIELPELINFLKLRASYAEVGNDANPYQLKNVYISGTPYASTPTVAEESVLANSGLRPERQKAYEMGTDIVLFRGKASIDFTYYNSNSIDQIIKLPLSSTSGYQYRYTNAGEINNHGIELMLKVSPIVSVNKTGFGWDMFYNFSKHDSKVISISEEYDEYIYANTSVYDNQSAQVYAIAKEGERLGNLYGQGFKKTDDGKVIFGSNGLPTLDPELKLLGNYNPDWTLGIGNEFSYKNFALSFLFDYRHGGIVVSRMFSIGTTSGQYEHTLEGRTVDNPAGTIIGEGVKWDEATQAYVENDIEVASQVYFNRFYTRACEENSTFDATFLKLKEIKFTYTLPNKLAERMRMKEARFAVVARNLGLWTSQKFFDPETITYENDMPMRGVEEMSYPSTYSIGFNLNFIF